MEVIDGLGVLKSAGFKELMEDLGVFLTFASLAEVMDDFGVLCRFDNSLVEVVEDL